MPVGAIIGAVASVGGALISSSSNSKAISQASDAQAQATREATALQKDQWNYAKGLEQPFYNTGIAAMGQYNALLGLGGANGVQTVPTTGAGGAPAPVPAHTPFGDALTPNNARWNMALQKRANGRPTPLLDRWEAQHGPIPGSAGAPVPTPTPTPTGQTAQQAAEAAYNQFKNYTGYTARLHEGENAINSGYAANGTLQSGDAMKALTKYGQDYASNEFGNYMSYLGGQQSLGTGAANAMAGAGQSYANNAGQLAIANGQNLANAAIARAQNSNQMWSGIASGIGGLAGSLGGSSYRF